MTSSYAQKEDSYEGEQDEYGESLDQQEMTHAKQMQEMAHAQQMQGMAYMYDQMSQETGQEFDQEMGHQMDQRYYETTPQEMDQRHYETTPQEMYQDMDYMHDQRMHQEVEQVLAQEQVEENEVIEAPAVEDSLEYPFKRNEELRKMSEKANVEHQVAFNNNRNMEIQLDEWKSKLNYDEHVNQELMQFNQKTKELIATKRARLQELGNELSCFQEEMKKLEGEEEKSLVDTSQWLVEQTKELLESGRRRHALARNKKDLSAGDVQEKAI